jgi:signal transduction histidine kinase
LLPVIGLAEVFWTGLLEVVELIAGIHCVRIRHDNLSKTSDCALVVAHLGPLSWEQLEKSANPGTVLVRVTTISGYTPAPAIDNAGHIVCTLVQPFPALSELDWATLIWGLLDRKELNILCNEPERSILRRFFIPTESQGLSQVALMLPGREATQFSQPGRTKNVAENNSFAELYERASEIVTLMSTRQYRFARMLHDEVSQELALASLDIQWVRRTLENFAHAESSAISDFASEIASLDQVIRKIHASIVKVNQLQRQLTRDQQNMEFGNLISGLRVLIRQTEDRFPSRIILSAGQGITHSRAIEIALYKIAWEAINSAINRPNCQNVVVSVYGPVSDLLLEIKDDGETSDDLTETKTAAFRFMQYFASQAGLSVATESSAEAGTLVRVILAPGDGPSSLPNVAP